MAIDLKERRSGPPGRRPTDKKDHVCIFHDDFEKKQHTSKTHTLNCLISIKDRIKAIEAAMTGMVTVKIAGIITSVAMTFLILFIGSAWTLMQNWRTDIKDLSTIILRLESRTDEVVVEQVKIGIQQQRLIDYTNEIRKDQIEVQKTIGIRK